MVGYIRNNVSNKISEWDRLYRKEGKVALQTLALNLCKAITIQRINPIEYQVSRNSDSTHIELH